MRERYLVDTSVFVRMYVEQRGFERALEVRDAFFAGQVRLETVDLVRIELGIALRKVALLPKKMTPDEYVAAVRSIDDMDVPVHVTRADTVERAADLVVQRQGGFPDAVLVTWALELGVPLLTADVRLINNAEGTGVQVESLIGHS